MGGGGSVSVDLGVAEEGKATRGEAVAYALVSISVEKSTLFPFLTGVFLNTCPP